MMILSLEISLELIKDAVASNPPKSTRKLSHELNTPTAKVYRGLEMLGHLFRFMLEKF